MDAYVKSECKRSIYVTRTQNSTNFREIDLTIGDFLMNCSYIHLPRCSARRSLGSLGSILLRESRAMGPLHEAVRQISRVYEMMALSPWQHE